MMVGTGMVLWSPAGAEQLIADARSAGLSVGGWSDRDAKALPIIDARGDEAAAIGVLGEQAGGAVVLVDDADPVRQDRLIAAGAFQVAVVGAGGEGWLQALRLAERARPVIAERRTRRSGAPATRWLRTLLADGETVTVVHVALLRLDLVNAAHGRGAGTALVDAAERRIAAQVAALAEDEGRVWRLPGPAFAALFPGSPERAITAAARIEEALARPFRLDGHDAVLGSRLGLAGARSGESAEALLARAAQAASPAAAASAAEDPLAVEVHHALTGGEVVVLYQPQALLDGGEIIGVEALVRWRHPERGLLGAELLLAAADRAGIGAALAEHIRRRVLAEVVAWPASLARLRVALNLTAGDLARPGSVDTLLDEIDASGVARQRLTLEVTEGEAMADLSVAANGLAALRSAGCRTAIDDFGTGYASLAWLAALPLDYLKLDRSLAQEVAGSPKGRLVAKSAIDLARSLGLAVIAEGVETTEQRDALAAAGCAVMQGFLLAPPLDGAMLVAMVEERG